MPIKTITNKVPNHQPRDKTQRLLELVVGIIPFAFFAMLVVLCRYEIVMAAALLLLYTIVWLVRLLGYGKRLSGSFYYLKLSEQIEWNKKLADITRISPAPVETNSFWPSHAEKWYAKMFSKGVRRDERLDPKQVYHAMIVAIYNEPTEIIEATLKAVRASKYDPKRMILILAYEERGGPEVGKAVIELVKKYGKDLKYAMAIKHPDGIPGEAKAKAGNITFAGRFLSDYCRKQKINSEHVLVTTLDADNMPHPQYLAGLAWTYCMAASRTKRSYQPIPLFNNNIWDVPALVRVIAADSSYWFMMESLRPQRLRLFSAHAQSLRTLEDVDYWNVEVVVEDGHQYWRTYFNYDGDHYALPIWLPISQDAVQSSSYGKTMKAQFRQLLRWSWGVADTPFVLRQSFRDKSISWPNKLVHIYRILDDYIAWSTAPIILAIGGWLPLLLNPGNRQTFLDLKLPFLISSLQGLALIILIVPVAATLLNLPPRPERYSRIKNVEMLLQWLLEPVALIGFISVASLNSHLRLIFNKPLEKFHVTEKNRAQ